MNFTRTAIPDVVICEPTLVGDNRGYFMETFRQDKLEQFLGYKVFFCQDNESRSTFGVLRGMHYQLPPFSQAKLVRVLEGSVLDVAVDIREGSATYGKYIAMELNEDNKKQLFVPRGFAHGFVVLSKTATFAYKCDNYYNPDYDRGFLFNDVFVGIDWKLPLENLKLSEKDRNQPPFSEALSMDFSEGSHNFFI